MSRLLARIARVAFIVRTLLRCGFLAPLRPDRYLRIGLAVRRTGITPLTGVSLAAARRPGGTAIVDERGSLTWAELDARCDARAHAVGPR